MKATVLHTLRKYEPGFNSYCGPSALSIVTGWPLRRSARLLATARGVKRCQRVSNCDMIRVLKKHGYCVEEWYFRTKSQSLRGCTRLFNIDRNGPWYRRPRARLMILIVYRSPNKKKRIRRIAHYVVWDRQADLVACNHTTGPVPRLKHRYAKEYVVEILLLTKLRRRAHSKRR